jgi:ribonuclease HII
VAAAVVLQPGFTSSLEGVRDSKQLSPAGRAQAAVAIRQVAWCLGVGEVPPEVVDQFGLAFAGQLAFWRAVRALPFQPEYLLVDGFPLWSSAYQQEAIVRGDQRSLSIAAASIIAKTTRDEIMRDLDQSVSGYGFARHKGYGSRAHATALARLGPSRYHRRSFRPVAAVCANG